MTNSLQVDAYSAYPLSAASPRVRLTSFTSRLRPLGVVLNYHPALTSAEYAVLESTNGSLTKAMVLARAATRRMRAPVVSDGLVLVHRLLFPSVLPRVDPPTQVDAYDFDDALFLGSILPENRRFEWLKREQQRSLAYMRRARLVIAGNGYLAARARPWSKRVEIVPSCVDTDVAPAPVPRDPAVTTFGWIGSKSSTPYLEPALRAFEAFTARGGQARLLLVGAGMQVDIPCVEQRSWSLQNERRALNEMDIGLMPVPDNPWTRGKCGYKILQYFAAGVPAIASPVGINRELVGTERGVLAESIREWISAFDQLASDTAGRREMGTAGRTLAEREYSYEAWAPRLAALLTSIA